MVNVFGPKHNEVNIANEQMVFKGVQLKVHKSVLKINSKQFFLSLSNNLKNRLFATQSLHVSSFSSQLFKDNQFLSNLDMLIPPNWPDSYDIWR